MTTGRWSLPGGLLTCVARHVVGGQGRDETAEARYEAGEEQVPPEEPRMGEAIADLDVPEDPAFEDEVDPSNDSFHGGADL